MAQQHTPPLAQVSLMLIGMITSQIGTLFGSLGVVILSYLMSGGILTFVLEGIFYLSDNTFPMRILPFPVVKVPLAILADLGILLAGAMFKKLGTWMGSDEIATSLNGAIYGQHQQ